MKGNVFVWTDCAWCHCTYFDYIRTGGCLYETNTPQFHTQKITYQTTGCFRVGAAAVSRDNAWNLLWHVTLTHARTTNVLLIQAQLSSRSFCTCALLKELCRVRALLRQHKVSAMRRKSVCIFWASSSGWCIIAIARIRAERRVLALSLATPERGEQLLLLPWTVPRAVVMLVQMVQYRHRLVRVDHVITMRRGWDWGL